jgi:hypothetical protein
MMSQPSASTMSSDSPCKKRKTTYAQLIGASFINERLFVCKLQPFGFANLRKEQLDLRFLNVNIAESISDGIKTVLASVKHDSKF